MSALLRVWPLLLTLPLHLHVGDAPGEKLVVMGLSCVAVAVSLLYYLMTQDLNQQNRERRSRIGIGTFRS